MGYLEYIRDMLQKESKFNTLLVQVFYLLRGRNIPFFPQVFGLRSRVGTLNIWQGPCPATGHALDTPLMYTQIIMIQSSLFHIHSPSLPPSLSLSHSLSLLSSPLSLLSLSPSLSSPPYMYNSHAQSYSKLEDLQPGSPELMQFTFLLISAVDYKYYQDSHKVVAQVEGFSRLSLNKREFPPLKIVLEDKIFVLMNNVRTK